MCVGMGGGGGGGGGDSTARPTPRPPPTPPQFLTHRLHDMDREACLTALDLIAEADAAVETHVKKAKAKAEEVAACAQLLDACAATHARLLAYVGEPGDGLALAQDEAVQEAMRTAETALKHARATHHSAKSLLAAPFHGDEAASSDEAAFGAGARAACETASAKLSLASTVVATAKLSLEVGRVRARRLNGRNACLAAAGARTQPSPSKSPPPASTAETPVWRPPVPGPNRCRYQHWGSQQAVPGGREDAGGGPTQHPAVDDLDPIRVVKQGRQCQAHSIRHD